MNIILTVTHSVSLMMNVAQIRVRIKVVYFTISVLLHITRKYTNIQIITINVFNSVMFANIQNYEHAQQ